MASRIKKGDKVKVISGNHKGTTASVIAVMPKKNAALLEGIGVSSRKVKPTQLNPMGGNKDVHTPMPLSKIALVSDAKPKAVKPAKTLKKTKETK